MRHFSSFIFLLVLLVCGGLVIAGTEPQEFDASVTEIEAIHSLDLQLTEINRKADGIRAEARWRLQRSGVQISDADQLALNPKNMKWRVILAPEAMPVTTAGTK